MFQRGNLFPIDSKRRENSSTKRSENEKNMDPLEVEFLAEKETVKIIPNFSLDKIYLIGVRKQTVAIVYIQVKNKKRRAELL